MKWLFLVCILASSKTWAANAGQSSFNPDLSVNGLFLDRSGNRGNDPSAANPNGFSFQEAELQFTSDIDTYMRGTALLSVGPTSANEFEISPEEVYLESLTIPQVTLKAGRFKTAIDKHNMLHSHAYPFIDAPLANTELLGEDLTEPGVSAAFLIPVSWYMDFTVQSVRGQNPNLFGNTSPNATVNLGRLNNLWEINDSLTTEFAVSYGQGKNSNEMESKIWGSDLIFKWRPTILGTYHAIKWTTQYLAGIKGNMPDSEISKGITTYLQYQLDQRWWVQGRTEYFDRLNTTGGAPFVVKRKSSALVAFDPSEFSEFRLQYDHFRDDLPTAEQRVTLQMNFVMGAHPAHSY
jgi:hypothetical protein